MTKKDAYDAALQVAADIDREVLQQTQAQLDRAAAALAPKPGEPWAGVDRAGMPPRDSGVALNLLSAEQSAFRRLSPRRNQWPAIARFDERVAQLEQRQSEASARSAELHERLQAAPVEDSRRLAAWELEDRAGPRPEATADALEKLIAGEQATIDGLHQAVAQVHREKVEHVEKHRARLVQEADRQVEQAHGRVVALLDELAAAREELVDLRAASAWASCYPNEAAGREPAFAMLAGGLRAPVEKTLGIVHQVRADHALSALRADADWIRSALTPEQRVLVEGKTAKPGDARWANSPEGIAQENAEREARRRAHEAEWGVQSSW